jgi:hypothetical protein
MPVLNHIPLFKAAFAMASHREPLDELFLCAAKFDTQSLVDSKRGNHIPLQHSI